jgi:two-component system phosphate regulon sensor histidine kinase PhoR
VSSPRAHRHHDSDARREVGRRDLPPAPPAAGEVDLPTSLVAAMAAAGRLAGLAKVFCLRIEGESLVEMLPAEEPLRLPLRDSLSGNVATSGRAQVADLTEEQLHARERALLRATDCAYWLAAPIVAGEGAAPEGVVVGLKPPPLGAGAGEEERTALSLVAENVALGWHLTRSFAAAQAERARARLQEGVAEGILHSLRAPALVLSEDGLLHDANRAAEALFDFRLPAVRGRPLSGVVTDPQVLEVLAQVDATGGGNLPEVRVGANRDVVLEVRINPIFDARGELRWRVVVFNDTTVLRQADELKTEFVSMVSHELRTPLTSIKAFAATLLRDNTASPSDQREWLRIIDRECDRLTALVNDLLIISRLESGRPLSMHFSEFDLMTMLKDVGEAQQAAARKHTVVLRGPAQVTLEADQDKIRQVFINLVNNAIKYSPRGGEVVVQVESTETSLRVLIQDQGVGIRPEHLNLVFEKFFQVDGSTTRRVGGSGLGLYLTRRLVEAHGGSVWAESELGRGTTVVVLLPKRAAAPVSGESGEGAAGQIGTGKP